MELFGKDVKNVLNKAKEKIGEAAKDMSASNQEHKEKANAAKAPVEGAIERYEVIYIGGLSQYPTKKSGAIGLNILPTCFVLKPTITALEWFDDMVIPYDSILDLKIVKRTVSNTEMLLSSSSSDMKSLEQENNINISFNDENGNENLLRIEMLTGFSVYGQAGKCREFMDVLRQNKILSMFKGKQDTAASTQSAVSDPIEQIKKLQELKDAGILSEDEFNAKKAELLSKI